MSVDLKGGKRSSEHFSKACKNRFWSESVFCLEIVARFCSCLSVLICSAEFYTRLTEAACSDPHMTKNR